MVMTMERKSIAVLALALVVISLVWLGGCSNQSGNSMQIANPSSVYCENHNGTLEIRTAADGGQVGYCKFSNGKECEEWAFYRGECSKELAAWQNITVKQSGGSAMLIAECMNRSYITDTSDYIIEGTVKSVESKWNEDKTSIFTYTNFLVENYAKGAPFVNDEIQIITPGGTVGNVSQAVEDQPILHEGKKVRIYLKKTNSEFVIVCAQFGVEEIA